MKFIVYFFCRLIEGLKSHENSFKKKIWILFNLTLIFFILIFSSLLIWSNVKVAVALKNYKPPEPSILLDRKNRVISKFVQKHRILTQYKDTPKSMIQAILATEDIQFYHHFGFNVGAIFRAFLINLKAGGIVQGGSTITQQLAKVILTSREKNIIRKVKELFLSLVIESIFTKNEIINLYLNQISFGHGYHGIGAASQLYFKKEIKDLKLYECAILATLPSAPNRYSPIKNPRLSYKRMQHVLLKMLEQNFISIKQAMQAYKNSIEYYKGLNLPPTLTAFGQRVNHAPYFTEYLRKKLIQEIGKEKLYTGGYKIYTTLDIDHQKIAQKVLWKKIEEQNKVSKQYFFKKHLKLAKKYSDVLGLITLNHDLPNIKNQKTYTQYELQYTFQKKIADYADLVNLSIGGDQVVYQVIKNLRKNGDYFNQINNVEGAFIEIDHKTGEITVMVGGSPFSSNNQINRAIQTRRQPGSTFKALLYAAALDTKKVTAASIFPDTPLVFLLDGGEDIWLPENYSGSYKGFINLRNALVNSANMVSIALAREVKLGNLMPKLANILQVSQKKIPYNYSITLGTYELSLLQLARSFTLFPRLGKSMIPYTIRRIVDSEGDEVYKFHIDPNPPVLLNPATAKIVTSFLEDVVKKGTGSFVRTRAKYNGFAAGKTGTSQNYKDAWFAGFNKRYTSVVWFGFDKGSISLGVGQAGGVVAAPTWGEYQRRLANFKKINQIEEEEFNVNTKVSMVNVCTDYGVIQSSLCTCTNIYKEMFIPGTEPKGNCTSGLEAPNVTLSNNDTSPEVKAVRENKAPIVEQDFFSEDDL